MLARIFRPARTAMQSGMAQTDRWMLEYEPEVPMKADPLMGYTSSSDMRQQLRIEFDSREDAVSYAERNGIPYRVLEAHERAAKKLSYSDNFRFNRPQAWTH
ncbi:MAG: ETC complex I subunit [Bauldia sp.]|nr:MAG: ETC complex I subunit [Bauldia sp.]